MNLIKDNFFYENNIPEDKEIGIEVEVESNNPLPKITEFHWTTKDDGSLRGNFNAEYVLTEPIDRQSYKKHITYLYKKLNINGFNHSERCGVHIHLNVRNNTIEEVFNIITIYLVLENLLINWIGRSREGNIFCLRARDAEYFLYALIEDKIKGIFSNTLSIEDFKYASINTSTINTFGSLEFRGLETPKDYKLILNWIKLLLEIKDYGTNLKNTQEILSVFSRNGPENFLNQIFSKNNIQILTKNENYKNLLTASIRKVQNLIYTDLGKLDKKRNIDKINKLYDLLGAPPPLEW